MTTSRQLILPTVQTFAVNTNNDLYIDEQGNLAIVYDLQAVSQACKQAALTLLGEMVLQTNQGIPYQTAIWVGVPNIPAFEGALRSSWLAIQGVTGVASLVTSIGPYTSPGTTVPITALSYSATIDTIFGSVSIATENIFNG
jgi:hypothetical protein